MTPTELFIGGNWIGGQGAELVSSCPVDESVVWQGNEADNAQVDKAYVLPKYVRSMVRKATMKVPISF